MGQTALVQQLDAYAGRYGADLCRSGQRDQFHEDGEEQGQREVRVAGGDLQRAFSYHPLVIAPLLLITMFIYRKKMPENYIKVMIAAVCAVFLIVYGIRMADPNDLVVTFDPKSGVISKTFDLIFRSVRDIGRM